MGSGLVSQKLPEHIVKLLKEKTVLILLFMLMLTQKRLFMLILTPKSSAVNNCVLRQENLIIKNNILT